jgi:coenzyme F420-0:L-glutamate ligase/coenzyme F420-1:gamma-L-glutamate ligase
MSQTIAPIIGLPEIRPDSDLGEILCVALNAFVPSVGETDALVVTQKIVSKAEGRFVDLNGVRPGREARRLAAVVGKDPRFVEVVLSESAAVVRAAPHVLITRHRSGHVMANAGVDRSNLGDGREDQVLLLPVDADASAERLRAQIAIRRGTAPAVLISDSFGRPWRNGVINVAIGAAGLPSLVDRRGGRDRDGRVLEVTQIGFADLVACAAGLTMGEGDEGIPAALVRGLTLGAPNNPASALIRPITQDLFQ